MPMTRRSPLYVLGGVVLACIALSAQAQRPSFPSGQVHLIVPAPPGSGPDAMGRLLSAKLSEMWGQPVVVDNVVGASGIIGHDKGAKAPADGHTLLMGLIGPMSVSQTLQPKSMPFDPVKDLAPITMLVKLPNILVVNPKVPVNNLQELIAYGKRNPEKIRYGYPGAGTSPHLAAEQFNLAAGTKFEGIPYKSSAQMTQEVVGGQIELIFHNAPVVMPFIRNGTLRGIGITSATRVAAAPDIPSLAESGLPNFDVTSWYALYAPARTPAALISAINADVAKALASPEIAKWIASQAGEAGGGSPSALADFQAAETQKWKSVINAAGIKGD